MAEKIELIQFPYSHYNEKVRWALDYKKPAHLRTDLIPGPHAMTTLRLTRQTQVPIVRFGHQVVHGSAAILDGLERRFPTPPLYPSDPAERDRALAVQRYFDEEVGPLVRRGVFAVLTQEPDYVCAMFTGDRNAAVRKMYRWMFPLTRAVMKSSMGIAGGASIDRAVEGTEQGLDFVAREASERDFLVGERLSIADVTAASLLAPAVMPEGSPMALPEPRPVRLQLWLAKWADHPGAEWVRRIYREHRGDQ